MLMRLRNFRNDESGAVTVDWVVLCAAIVALATVAYVQVDTQTRLLSAQAAGDVATQVR